MLCKCSVKNVGTAAGCADNEYWTDYWLRHCEPPRFSVLAVAPGDCLVLVSDSSSCFPELYDIFIKYLQELSMGLSPV